MKCPLCKTEETSVVKVIQVDSLVNGWGQDFGIDVRPEFHGVPAMELRECQGCSLQFFMPESLAGSAQLYAQLEKFDWYYMPRKWEYDVALEDLRGCEKILEVGCGSGGFIALADREAGLHVEGLEQNATAVEKAARNGLPVRLGAVESAAEQFPGTYDAVCSFQVLEHVPNPGEFLGACCALLRPGGKLLLGLPNSDSFLRYQKNLLDLPPHHMSRWSGNLLSKLPQLLPIRLRRIKFEPLADYHIEGYVDAYSSHLFPRSLASLARIRINGVITRLLRRSGFHRWLRGQTTYVCYERK